MKKSLLFLFLFLAFGLLLLVPKTTLAAEPKCWCTGKNMEKCTLYSPSCPSGDAQGYEDFTVCCNEPNLYNSVFALKSPICGSSLEKPIIGCEIGTFADGNSMTFCVGNEFRRGQTDAIFNGKDNVNFDPGGSFTYNGNFYSSGNVYVCNSVASCCAQSSPGFKCQDIYKPNPYDFTALVDNNALPNNQRAALCGLSGEPDDDLVRYVHTNIGEYELTCVDTPVVDVVRATCSSDAGGEGAPYGEVTRFDPSTGQEFIDVQALVNLARARLGGYGPDAIAQRNNSLDALAKVYPYNAFLNLAFTTNAPRETSGTFWRLMNQLEQMNAKAKLFLRYKQQTPPLRDQDIVYRGREAAQESEADGAALAGYMNAIIAGVSNSKVRLLSPAFNITSRFTPPLITEMLSAGARFNSLAGCAGNTYTVDGQGAYSWFQSFLAQVGALASACNSWVFTEFGDFDTFGKPLNGRPDVIARMTAEFSKTISDPKIAGALYFNAMGGNGEFAGHQLSQNEYRQITAGNPGKGGVNSAKPFDGGAFQDAAASYTNGSGWTLEIANSPGDEDTVVNSINRALSRGLTPIIRICVGNSCDFADPQSYVEFLERVASRANGAFYAIAGPNEPEREQWIGTTPGEPAAAPPETTTLSSLMRRLPSCLLSFPVCSDAISVYAALDSDTRIVYDSLLPFNQDNLRGYLGLNYIEPVESRTNVGILTEGLPYIETIKEVLNDPSFGVVNALSPGWLNDLRSSQNTSENYITPREEKDNRGVIEKVAEKIKQIWSGDVVADKPEQNILGCYLHKKGTALPAPTTYPKDFSVQTAKPEWRIVSEEFPKSLYQFLRVPVKTVETPNSEKCIIKDRFGRETGRGTYYETSTIQDYERSGPDNRGERYLISNVGRAIAVLNNPKMTDISRLISEPKNNTNYSLTAMMLPDFAQLSSYVNTPLLADSASYDSTIYVYTDPATRDSAAGGKDKSSSGIIARKGGQAHIDLCQLRNFWFRPAGLQLGRPEDCENLDRYINITTGASPYIADIGQTNSAGQCTLPAANFDTTLRATIQKMHNNPASNASKVPLEFLFAVYEIESFPYFTGYQEYVCQENSVGAAGPFQIVKSTYNLLTCDSERIANDIPVCQAESGQLSRCDIEDNIELGARAILFSAGRWLYGPGNCSATSSISPTDKAVVYKAANNYYGSCNPDAYTSAYKLQISRPNGGRTNYGDIVLEKMGLIKTASDYPQPQCP